MAGSWKVRFCTSSDGAKLAYVRTGAGPAIVESAYRGHLYLVRESPLWRHWIGELAHDHEYIRYDSRGYGLSDRDVSDVSFEAMVRDLEAVVAAAAPEKFVLVGHSSGGAVAVAYAVRHPERVSHLVLFNSYLRGQLKRATEPRQVDEALLYYKIAEVGWDMADPSWRVMSATRFVPDAPAEYIEASVALSRASATPAMQVRFMKLADQIDLTELAPKVACPCLVVNSRGGLRSPMEEGRRLAALLPDARFVTLQTPNHFVREDEPAWGQFVAELRAFLPAAPGGAAAGGPFAELTAREREMVDLLARGLDNHQIAAHLELTEKTVRNMVSSVLDKLGVESRAQAIVRAREAGYGVGSTA